VVLQIARNTWGPGTGTAIYSRVSTADHNPELQLREIQDYADRQGWKGVETHQDTISGGKATVQGSTALWRTYGARREAGEFPCPRDHPPGCSCGPRYNSVEQG